MNLTLQRCESMEISAGDRSGCCTVWEWETESSSPPSDPTFREMAEPQFLAHPGGLRCCMCAAGRHCVEELAGSKPNKMVGKNKEVQGQLLLSAIGNRDVDSGQNIELRVQRKCFSRSQSNLRVISLRRWQGALSSSCREGVVSWKEDLHWKKFRKKNYALCSEESFGLECSLLPLTIEESNTKESASGRFLLEIAKSFSPLFLPSAIKQ